MSKKTPSPYDLARAISRKTNNGEFLVDCALDMIRDAKTDRDRRAAERILAGLARRMGRTVDDLIAARKRRQP